MRIRILCLVLKYDAEYSKNNFVYDKQNKAFYWYWLATYLWYFFKYLLKSLKILSLIKELFCCWQMLKQNVNIVCSIELQTQRYIKSKTLYTANCGCKQKSKVLKRSYKIISIWKQWILGTCVLDYQQAHTNSRDSLRTCQNRRSSSH